MDHPTNTFARYYGQPLMPSPTAYGSKPEIVVPTERSSSPFAKMPVSPPLPNKFTAPAPTLVRSGSTIKVPRTYAQWTVESQASTAEFLKQGSTTPFVWACMLCRHCGTELIDFFQLYVEGHNIPPNAVVAGDERGKPLYVARTFFEGTLRTYRRVRPWWHLT